MNTSEICDYNLKIKEMTLEDIIHSSDIDSEKKSNENSVELDLCLPLKSDNSSETTNNSSEFTFENVIGHLEDMLIDESFYKLQNGFLEKYWKEFDDSEENKHSYMVIFQEYTTNIEDFIVSYLKQRIQNFDMDKFASDLEHRKNNLEGEIFEVLLTLSDFKAFKEIFLDYRAMKEGHTIDLSKSLNISSISS